MAAVDVQRPWQSISPIVDAISRKAIADLNSRAMVVPDITADPVKQKELLKNLVEETISSYGSSVSDATMVWLEEQEDYMGMRPVEWRPTTIDEQQIQNRMARDFAPLFFEEQSYSQALVKMGYIVSDALYERQRNSTALTAWKGNGRWARVAHPGACAFCQMLASRGFDYSSRRTAGGGNEGAHYHDSCRCLVICRKRGKVELPESTRRAQRLYSEAVKHVPASNVNKVAAAMREQGGLSH
ncbi:hypothetical protein [Corynebacterium amycolatum]|uniref:VG15 protein n=1 Tax=Corynebacterium amycolatum TaxID=43765 RepID=UPI00191DE6FD|nr:hypothetical protein [Corynebacterium amycolatum]QQU97792.1 hypothetical protein I6I65_10745 [Corynebacterium amycolatum]